NKNDGVSFKDLGGMKELLMEVEDTVIVPLLKHRKLVDKGIELRMGNILFHGPPGCGKTTLAHAIANESSLPLYKLSPSDIAGGPQEEILQKHFSKAYKTAPSIIFIDEIDAIASKRDNLQLQSDRRIVTQLMSCMDECHRHSLLPTSHEDSCYVLVIGATNRPHALEPAVRRPGRFEKEILLGVPDENARFDILSRKLKLPPHHHQASSSLDILKIARSTPGFVPTDFDALISQANSIALRRAINIRKPRESRNFSEDDGHKLWKETWLDDAIDNLNLTMTDIEAITKVQPSSKKEGSCEIPNDKWEDIGGLHDIRQELERSLINCIKYPEHSKRCGRAIETGFLLFGPKGCGKTSIAKAVANEARANFIYIQGPELLDKYVGESERAIRTLFSRARTCSPCIIFFDEMDGLREKREFQKGRVVQQLVTQLLTELDGRNKRDGVFVIGATNRIDHIDEAFLRPGRFCKRLYVPLPGPDERGMILKALGKERPIDPTVNLIDIAKMEACENFNGADLYHLMREATLAALDEAIANSSTSDTSQRTVKVKHFEQVVTKISPSVSKMEKKLQWRLAKRFMACNLQRNTTEGHSE
ncbi:cell division control protein 48 homolog C, partial [Ziziphus jujuba]|uniref:Cell division control protein 48 homolog C n=1 Tax=Ziziphus jujuba TaxID=326968 RepID=A0ABM3ZXI5_ZIZJJ